MSITVQARAAQLLGVRTNGSEGTDDNTKPHVIGQYIGKAADVGAALGYLFSSDWSKSVGDPTNKTHWDMAMQDAIETVNSQLSGAGVKLEFDLESPGAYFSITNSSGQIIGHITTIVLLDKSHATKTPQKTTTVGYGDIHAYATIAIG